MAAAAVLGPAALGSLTKAVKKRASGAAPSAGAFWFYVSQPTPVFGIDDHRTVAGQLQPGSWFLARDTYGKWLHVEDKASGLEGWISSEAAQAASQ